MGRASRMPGSAPEVRRTLRGTGTLLPVSDPAEEYLAREAKARINIDRQLVAAGWVVQHADKANLGAGRGVAVREFVLEKGHGRVDYLLFIDGQPVGVIEAKPEGTTLTEVEHQSGKYVDGLPGWMKPPVYPLPFIYESTGAETHFTNGYDPDATSTLADSESRGAYGPRTRHLLWNPDAQRKRQRRRSIRPGEGHEGMDHRRAWSQANVPGYSSPICSGLSGSWRPAPGYSRIIWTRRDCAARA